MLPTIHRLPLTKSTNTHQLQGKRVSNHHLSLIYQPNLLNHFRAAFVVSKKIEPLAVHRNRLKRRLSHALAQTIPATLSYDLLIIPKVSAKKQSFSELKSSLHSLVSQSALQPNNKNTTITHKN